MSLFYRIGFLEESAGVRSMSRLAIAWLLVLATALVAVIAWYIYHFGATANPLTVTSLVGGLTALVLNGIVAITKRHPPDGKAE